LEVAEHLACPLESAEWLPFLHAAVYAAKLAIGKNPLLMPRPSALGPPPLL
jgi:hypothetical protein